MKPTFSLFVLLSTIVIILAIKSKQKSLQRDWSNGSNQSDWISLDSLIGKNISFKTNSTNFSFTSNDGPDYLSISTSNDTVVSSSKPLQSFEYLIDGVMYFIKSTKNLTIEQVKQRMDKSKQESMKFQEEAEDRRIQAEKAIEEARKAAQNAHQMIQNSWPFIQNNWPFNQNNNNDWPFVRNITYGKRNE